jgi:hypothetical protein
VREPFSKPPLEVLRVIDACPALTPFQRLLYRHHWMLHNGPDGAHVSAGGMALRLAVSKDYVEQQRRQLVTMGMLLQMRGRRRTASWYPQFPDSCLPPSIDQSKRGLDDKAIAQLGQQLATWIAGEMAHSSTPLDQKKPKHQGPRLAHPSTPLGIAELLPNGALETGSPPGEWRTPVRQSGSNGVLQTTQLVHNGAPGCASIEVCSTEGCNNLKPHKAAPVRHDPGPMLPLLTVTEGGGSHEPVTDQQPAAWRAILETKLPRASQG